MTKKPVHSLDIAYVRNDRRRSERSQRVMVTPACGNRIYTDWPLMIRQRRPGSADTLHVSDLWIIVDPARRTTKGGLAQSLVERRAEARRAGIVAIVEASTGLRSDNPEQADKMLAAALATISGTRRRSRTVGRPRVIWSDSDLVVVRMHWQSRQHANDRAALAAMKADGIRGAYYQRVYAELGPSGRRPGGDEENRAAQWAKRKKQLKR